MSTLSGGPNIVTDGLVLNLDASNIKSYPGTGNIWDDLSRGGSNGTLINGPTFDNGNGGSIVFDGVNDYVRIGGVNDYNYSNITLESWVYPERNSSYEYLFSNSRDCCGSYNGYELRIVGGFMRFTIWNSTNANVISTYSLPLNSWYHIIATYDGSQLKLYINGIINKLTNSTLQIGYPTSYDLYIGRMGHSSSYIIKGKISLSKIYNRSLSAQEVLQNYNSTTSRFGL